MLIYLVAEQIKISEISSVFDPIKRNRESESESESDESEDDSLSSFTKRLKVIACDAHFST